MINPFKALFYRVLILVALSASCIFSQTIDTVIVNGDSLQKKAIKLDMKWSFHDGDSAIWADPEYDASGWDTINTRLIVDEIPEDLWSGIGWFRKTFRIDSSLQNQIIGLMILQYGASQIFLNGELIHDFGKVSADPAEEEIFDPNYIPIHLQLDDHLVYTLAIRYSNHKAITQAKWYKKWYVDAGFQTRIAPLYKAVQNKVMDEALNMVINMGIAFIFISLSFLYLVLFIFYARRRENLYYFLFTFFISLIFSSGMIPRFFPGDYAQRTFWGIMSGQSILFVFWAYIGFLYSIFNERMPKKFWIASISVIIISSSIFLNIPETILEIIVLGFIIISTLEGLRIIIQAIRAKREHAWVIGVGVIIFVAFITFLFIVGLLDSKVGISILLTIFVIGLLCIPITMSVYLARSIAGTNEKLVRQLETVKELSKREIEHQKQQAEHERKTKELEEARQLQLSMLPKELPQLPNLDIAVYMQTATEVGGDYYDFHVSMDGALTIVVGDATGHGMKAGTVVTASKSLFSTHAENPDILFTFKETTRCLKIMDLHMLSMCMMIMKINHNKIQFSSAGMPPVLIYRHTDNLVEELVVKGMPLGTFKEFDYQLRETTINPGDVILLMSDGMPELFNEEKEMFGYDRIQDIFKTSASQPVDEIISHLKAAGHDWVNGANPQDDVTFVAIKMKNGRENK